MKKLLESIHSTKNKGFVLAYSLYLLLILLAISTMITNSVMKKVEIEKRCKEIEKQKDIELVLYSYFINHPYDEQLSLSIDDYEIDYNAYTLLESVYLDASIISIDTSYLITYRYSKISKHVVEIIYQPIST